MNDIIESQKRASVKQGWVFGERMNRFGDPFKWIDGDQLSMLKQVDGALAVLQYLAMSGEIYETPKQILTSDAQDISKRVSGILEEMFSFFVPFQKSDSMGFRKYIESTASVKQQDYCAIKTYCTELASKPNHLDLGPGLGANAIYSRLGLDSTYFAIEAFASSYNVQRNFFRFIARSKPVYLDVVECETFMLAEDDIKMEINSTGKFNYKHVPSWHFEMIEQNSIDLVSATWVLNEVNPAGIVWLLYNVNKALKNGGYFYIRDSFKRKPQRHDLDYDEFLENVMGFKKVGFLDIRNRVDMHGIPRVYQKVKPQQWGFETLYERAFGRFAVTAHNGSYIQHG